MEKEIRIQLSYNQTILGKFVRWFTNSKFSHVDIVIPREEIGSDFSFGYLIGSRPMQGVIMHNKKYHVEEQYILPVTQEEYDVFWDFVKSQMASYYDWLGVITWPFAKWLNRDWDKENWWFCSELVAAGLKRINVEYIFNKPNKVSPEDLTNIFKKVENE